MCKYRRELLGNCYCLQWQRARRRLQRCCALSPWLCRFIINPVLDAARFFDGGRRRAVRRQDG